MRVQKRQPVVFASITLALTQGDGLLSPSMRSQTASPRGGKASTDSFDGGKSKAEFAIVPGGALESKGSLRVAGTIELLATVFTGPDPPDN